MRFLLILVLSLTMQTHAQSPDSVPTRSRKGYDFNFHGGTLVGTRIAGITEVMNTWGLRIAIPSGKGMVELDSFFGRGDGNAYNSFAIDYRFDFDLPIAVHGLTGLHADQWTINDGGKYYSGGWHFGGGLAMQISGPIFFRSDFKYRLGPGQSVDVSLGILYFLSDAKSSP